MLIRVGVDKINLIFFKSFCGELINKWKKI